MTLSSQSARSSRPGPRTRGKKKGLPWKPLFVLGLLIGAVWFLFLRDDDTAGPGATASTGEVAAVAATNNPAPESNQAAPSAGLASAEDAATPQGGGEVEASASSANSFASSAAGSSAGSLVRPGVVEQLRRPDSGVGVGSSPPSAIEALPLAPLAPPPPPRSTRTSAAAAAKLAEGLSLLEAGNFVKGRNVLSVLLLEDDEPLSIDDANVIRNRLTEINSRLVFSPEPVPNDNVTTPYVVQPGDLLGSIAIRSKVPYPLLEIMNRTKAPRMQVGQNLKLLRGPVHARVSKTDFTMDLYAFGDDSEPVFLCALPVGLGANDGTPLGRWLVGRSKVTNPSWKNPRTGEYFASDNPDIPIGEFWIPIEGLEGASVGRTGFGIHGTNEPDSIGSMQSMGCIRLLDGDIELVYHMLEPRESEVVIVP